MDRRKSQLWMQTYTGRRFYPNDIRPSDICIEDIAHALSQICRFGGHCKTFYSVAQHSVHVAELVAEFCNRFKQSIGEEGRRHIVAHALLHDASEAYLGDCVTPLKQALPSYKEIEVKAEAAVLKWFGITMWDAALTKTYDRVMLVTEARDLLGKPSWMKDYEEKPWMFEILPWSPALSETMFLEYAKRLELL